MAPGRYPATFYVGLAFWGQTALTTYFLWTSLLLASGSRAPVDLITTASVALAFALTFLIFWDRWKCNAVFCSQYCSGCANISMLYVPVAAFCYAN